MSKIGIVIQREYLTRVKKKSFIILTILMPLLFVGLIGGTAFLAMFSVGEIRNIVVADRSGEYFDAFHDTKECHFIKAENEFADFRSVSDDDVYATLVITDDLLTHPDSLTLYSTKQIVGSVESTIELQLNDYLRDKKLASYNIPDLKKIMDECKEVSVAMKTFKIDEAGNENKSSAEVATVIGMIFTFLIYMFIFTYGAMVMQGVMEEKTNRILEVMVSSVKPFDLMMGKLIGIGLVGLTQFGIWMALIVAINFSASFLMSGSEQFMNVVSGLNAVNMIELSLFFMLFFIGGFMIYASLFAAIGAMINSPEDSQQYMMPITILIIFAFMSGIYSAQNPDGPLAFWTSFIPFTSPIVMMTRLPYDVPLWQIILSIAILFVTVVVIVMLSAKIYRVGILMYGKKPTYGEIMKWIRY